MKIILKIIVFTSLLLLISGVKLSASEKIKIGLLVPLSGKNEEIGKSIVQAVRLAVNKINNPIIEIYPKDTKSDPDTTLEATKELKLKGIKIFIGPIFNQNLIHKTIYFNSKGTTNFPVQSYLPYTKLPGFS